MSAAEDRLAYQRIESWVEAHLGLHFDPEQQPAVRRRIRGLAERMGYETPGALLERLSKDPSQLSKALAETVATHHTGFFRESMVLDRIVREIVPTLGAGRERHRVWSAASSTGEELHSVAIILAEHLGFEEARSRFALLGTDLVQKVVRTAERGEYGGASMRTVSPERRTRWFDPMGQGRFRVGPDIRSMVTFRRLNLVKENWPFQHRFSVILCRNVLYYFDKPVRARIVKKLYDACEPGGWLLTSVSENLHELGSRWQSVSSGVHRKPR